MRRIIAILILYLLLTGCQSEPPAMPVRTMASDDTLTTEKTFRWTPSEGQVGIHNITFTATDSHGATASQTVTITVLPGDGVMSLNEFVAWRKGYREGLWDIDTFPAFLKLWGLGWKTE